MFGFMRQRAPKGVTETAAPSAADGAAAGVTGR
jgi:hypothetical protein